MTRERDTHTGTGADRGPETTGETARALAITPASGRPSGPGAPGPISPSLGRRASDVSMCVAMWCRSFEYCILCVHLLRAVRAIWQYGRTKTLRPLSRARTRTRGRGAMRLINGKCLSAGNRMDCACVRRVQYIYLERKLRMPFSHGVLRPHADILYITHTRACVRSRSRPHECSLILWC